MPRLKYLLLDERQLARQPGLSRLKNLAAAVIRLEYPRNEAAIVPLLHDLIEWLDDQPELRRSFAIWIRAVLFRRNRLFHDRELAIVDDLKELRMGLAETMERWAKDHQKRGRQEGLKEGRQEGLALGRKETAVHMLERVLNKRFGPLDPSTHARLEAASLDDLETWLDRALDAKALQDVFRLQ